MRMVCTGASQPMKTTHVRSWNNVTASYIARAVLDSYHLRAVVDTSDILYTHVSQSGETDFRFLARLAQQIGYKFFVVNTTGYFINPLRVLRAPDRFIPQFSRGNLSNQTYSLRTFQPIVGESVANGGSVATQVGYAIDARTNALIGAKEQILQYSSFQDSVGQSPQIVQHRTERPASSPQELARQLAAEAALQRNWVSAKAVTQGDCRLRPSSLVALYGDGLAPSSQGLWLVRDVVHTLRLNTVKQWDYTNSATLGRDQVYTATAQPPAQWVAAKAAASAELRNNAWVAPTSSVVG